MEEVNDNLTESFSLQWQDTTTFEKIEANGFYSKETAERFRDVICKKLMPEIHVIILETLTLFEVNDSNQVVSVSVYSQIHPVGMSICCRQC